MGASEKTIGISSRMKEGTKPMMGGPDRVTETIQMSGVGFCKMFTVSPSLRSISVCDLAK